MSTKTKVVTTAGTTTLLAIVAVVLFSVTWKSESVKSGPVSGAGKVLKETVQTPTVAALPEEPAKEQPTVYTWKSWGVKDGLPSNKVMAVRVDGERVWLGTNNGLVLYENGRFKTFTKKDGLSHDAIINLEVDSKTGDVWIATASGLTRYSGGKFTVYNQFNSGLQNDFIYSIKVDGTDLWVTTAAGASRLNQKTGQWDIFNETNTPMHEPWTYCVAAEGNLVYVGAWGGGVLEYNKTTGVWKEYNDPDGEMEVDVFRDDGPVHDITSYCDYEAGLLWQTTYFGLSVFDGTRWQGYFMEDSGLAGNFLNFGNARGRVGWIGSDRGLSSFDLKTWRTYKRRPDGKGEVIVSGPRGENKKTIVTPTAIVHNYVLAIDFQGEAVWIGTEDGVSMGVPEQTTASL